MDPTWGRLRIGQNVLGFVGLGADRMSGVAKRVSPEQALFPAVVDRMSLAWVACPSTRERLPSFCVCDGVGCGGSPEIPAHTLQTCFLLLLLAGRGGGY
jgi:hypothetical protein